MDRLSFVFAYAGSVVGLLMQARKQFVVTCERCLRDVPSGLEEFPFKYIVVICPLCGEQRRYLPSECSWGSQIAWWPNRHAQRCAEVLHQGSRGVSIFPLRFYPPRDKPDLVLNNIPRFLSYALKEARLP